MTPFRTATQDARHFLRFVDAGKYDSASFYRAARLDNQKPSDITT